MNIATGKLEAPVEKTASGFTEALQQAGEMLAKYKGSTGLAGGLLPIESYALSAGLGAGAQQAVNRTLGRRLPANPKLLKALELGSAAAIGGGSGVAGALAAPLSSTIKGTTGVDAARRLAEITAMGTGAEIALTPVVSGLMGSTTGALAAPLSSTIKGTTGVDAARRLAEITAKGTGAEMALSPVVSGLRGSTTGAIDTLTKLLGGGSLAVGGRVAADMREIGAIKNLIATGRGRHLPRAMRDPRFLNAGASDIIKARLGTIPQGGLLGAAGLALAATGNPLLGVGAGLTGAFKYTTPKGHSFSRYLGDISRELISKKKTKDALDGLYKTSSYSPRLLAPVYMTSPSYILDAPTLEKLGSVLRLGGEFANLARAASRQVNQRGRNVVKLRKFSPQEIRRLYGARPLPAKGGATFRTRSLIPPRGASTGQKAETVKHIPVSTAETSSGRLEPAAEFLPGSALQAARSRARQLKPGERVRADYTAPQGLSRGGEHQALLDQPLAPQGSYHTPQKPPSAPAAPRLPQRPAMTKAERYAREAEMTQGSNASFGYPSLNTPQVSAPQPTRMPDFKVRGDSEPIRVDIGSSEGMDALRASIQGSIQGVRGQGKALVDSAVSSGGSKFRDMASTTGEALSGMKNRAQGLLERLRARRASPSRGATRPPSRAAEVTPAVSAPSSARELAYEASFVQRGPAQEPAVNPLYRQYTPEYFQQMERDLAAPFSPKASMSTRAGGTSATRAPVSAAETPAAATSYTPPPASPPLQAGLTPRRRSPPEITFRGNVRTSIPDVTLPPRPTTPPPRPSLAESAGATSADSQLAARVQEGTTQVGYQPRSTGVPQQLRPSPPGQSSGAVYREGGVVSSAPPPNLTGRPSLAESAGATSADSQLAARVQEGTTQVGYQPRSTGVPQQLRPSPPGQSSGAVYREGGVVSSAPPPNLTGRPSLAESAGATSADSQLAARVQEGTTQVGYQPRSTGVPQQLRPSSSGQSSGAVYREGGVVSSAPPEQYSPPALPGRDIAPESSTLVDDLLAYNQRQSAARPQPRLSQSANAPSRASQLTPPVVTAEKTQVGGIGRGLQPGGSPASAAPTSAGLRSPRTSTSPGGATGAGSSTTGAGSSTTGASSSTTGAGTGGRHIPIGPNVARNPSADVLSAAEAAQAGMGSGQLRAPRLSLNKNIINDQQAAIDVLSVRGTGAGQDGIELAETLELIEGAGGLRGSGELKALRRSVQKTQEEALRSTNLNQRALENQAALNNLSSVSPGTAPVDNLLRQSIRDLSAESTQLTRENILLKMQSHPAARNNSITIPQDFGTRVDGILSSTQGKELLEAQKLLDDSFREYQGKLTAGLNNSLQKLAPKQSKDLAKAVEKATKPRGGVLGIGATEVAQADKQVITNIQALVEGRANIVTEGGMSLKGHRQASELKRVAKEVIESRDPKAMKELETALANPQFEFSSVQRSSKLHTFLDSRSRNVSLGMDSSQARKLHEMVGLEGRGTGDIAKQTTEFFSTKALNSPNSPAGAELSSVMNGLGDEGAQLLRMGREGGPAGNSAFGKIMSGDPAMARAEAYTKAELEALVSDKQVLKDSIDKARNLAPGHEALFDQYISSNKPIGDSLREIDRNLGKLASKAGPKVQREVARLTEVRAALQGVATDQQAALSTKFDAASRGVTTARDLISKDISIGRLNLPPSVAQGAIAQEAAAQGGAGALGTVATIGGVGGLAGILASRGSSRPATQAKQQVAATASFGLSPLHAPVIHNKLAASVKAIPLKNTQPKLPDPMKIPAQSLLTSTPQAREQAMKMSSLLAAPIRAY